MDKLQAALAHSYHASLVLGAANKIDTLIGGQGSKCSCEDSFAWNEASIISKDEMDTAC